MTTSSSIKVKPRLGDVVDEDAFILRMLIVYFLFLTSNLLLLGLDFVKVNLAKSYPSLGRLRSFDKAKRLPESFDIEYKRIVKFIRDYRFALLFLLILTGCGVLVIRGLDVKRARHQEVREAFLVLNSTDHSAQTLKLYARLIRELEEISDRSLLDDYQRFSSLVDPSKPDADSLVWKYYRSVANELEKRSRTTVVRALKLAEEVQ